MSEMFNYCHVVGKTDVGRRRKANEDNMANAVTPNGLVSVVCDGMGGHVGGATASRIAVNTIIEHLQATYYDDPRIAIGEAIDRANEAILQQANQQPELQGMGSTCVLLIVRAGKVYYGHVGDSRIYLVQSRRIKQLTKDHSYVQMLVDAGQITKEQAEHHPRKNEITNALGIPNMQPATVAEDAILPDAGDCFVLCSDGLSGMVSDETICKVVSRQAEMNAQDRVDKLVQLANDNGGVDNITVQIVEFSVSPANAVKAEKNRKIPKWLMIGGPIVLALLLIGIGLIFFLRRPQSEPQEDNPLIPVGSTNLVVNGDTTELTLGPVVYKQGAKLVELVYNDESIDLKTENGLLYSDNVKLNPATLKVESSDIEVKYNNSLLLFTDKNPGKRVSFTLNSASDTTKVYRYNINISDEQPIQTQLTKTGGKTIKVELVDYTFEFTDLKIGDQLRLDYKSRNKLTLSFNEENKPLDLAVRKINFEQIAIAEGWKCESVLGNPLVIKFVKPNSADSHEFLLPCEDKDGKPFCIRITLKKKVAESVEDSKKSLIPATSEETVSSTPSPENSDSVHLEEIQKNTTQGDTDGAANDGDSTSVQS